MAAGFVTLLSKLVRVQQGRRRRGRAIPRPTGAQARVELAARIGADVNAAQMVDVGLRFLAARLMASPVPVPPVLGVEVHADRLHILLDAPASDIPDGFQSGADPSMWVWEAPADLDRLDAELADVVPPLPALVSLGRTDAGIIVLANLGAVGMIRLDGDRQAATEAVTAMAVEMATSRWAQHSRVVLVGFGHPEGLGLTEPVELVDHLEDCLPRLRATAGELHAIADSHGIASLDHLRLGGLEPVDLGPSIVICIDQPNPDAFTELAQLTSDPASGLGAVVVTGSPRPAGSGWQLTVSAQGMIEITPLARVVHAQRLPLPLLHTMEERLTVAHRADDVDETIPVEDWWPADVDQNGVPDDAEELDEQDSPDEDGVEEPDGQDSPDEHDGEELVPVDSDRPAHTATLGGEAHHPSVTEAASAQIDEQGIGGPLAEDHNKRLGSGGRLRVVTAAPQVYSLPAEGCPGGAPEILVQVLQRSPRVLRLTPDTAEEIVVSRQRSLEMIVYLASHEEGVSRRRLAEVLHPEAHLADNTPLTSTFSTELSTARKSLGAGADGRALFPHKRGEKYQLDPAVALDATVMQRLLTAAEHSANDEEALRLLSAAFALVGDDGPLTDIRRGLNSQRRNGLVDVPHWRWFMVELVDEIEETVVDVATGLSELLWHARNVKDATRVLRKALKVSSLNRDLWKLYLSVEAERGHDHLQVARSEMERTCEAHAEPHDTVDPALRQHADQLQARRTS